MTSLSHYAFRRVRRYGLRLFVSLFKFALSVLIWVIGSYAAKRELPVYWLALAYLLIQVVAQVLREVMLYRKYFGLPPIVIGTMAITAEKRI